MQLSQHLPAVKQIHQKVSLHYIYEPNEQLAMSMSILPFRLSILNVSLTSAVDWECLLPPMFWTHSSGPVFDLQSPAIRFPRPVGLHDQHSLVDNTVEKTYRRFHLWNYRIIVKEQATFVIFVILSGSAIIGLQNAKNFTAIIPKVFQWLDVLKINDHYRRDYFCSKQLPAYQCIKYILIGKESSAKKKQKTNGQSIFVPARFCG